MPWVRRHEWTSPVVTAYSTSHILLWFVPFSIFPHPFFHFNIFHYAPPLSVFGLFQQRRLPLQLIGSRSEIRLIITNQFKLNSDRSSWFFFQFVKSRHEENKNTPLALLIFVSFYPVVCELQPIQECSTMIITTKNACGRHVFFPS